MRKNVQRSFVFIVVACLGSTWGIRAVRGDSWRLAVRGSEKRLGETPVVVKLKQAIPLGLYAADLPDGNSAFTAQVFEEKGQCYLAIVLPLVEADRTTTYVLKGPAPAESHSSNGLSFENHERNLKVKLDQQLLTEYFVGIGNKPYFFPLNGPTGDAFTRTYPMAFLADEDHDHPHHRSCWFTFGKVNGVDFWSEGKKFGQIKETGRNLVVAGPVVGRLKTEDDWRTADGYRMCKDQRTVTFYRTKAARIIDFDFRITASDGPVTFGDTKEGMFGIRVASSMDANAKHGGKITNAEGVTGDKAWGKASAWVDYVGQVKKKTVGIAIINHPASFRYPTTWHVRTYGLFAANPFGWHDFKRPEKGDYTIPAGQSIEFSYRVVLHEGDTGSADVPALAAGYSQPPVVEIAKE